MGRLAAALAWFGAVVLFVLSPAIGSIGSIIAVLLALLLSPVVFVKGNWTALRAQPAMLIFVASFAALTAAFAVTARHSGDVLFSLNFAGLLLAPVVYLLAFRRPGPRTITVLAALFVLGTLVGALTGSYDVFIQHKERAVGWASGGNLMARTVIPLGFLGLVGIFVGTSRWRWLYALGPVFAVYTLFLTSTRGVFIALPVLGILFLLTLLAELRATRPVYVLGLGALVAVALLTAMISPRFLGVGEIVREIVTGAQVADGATSERLYKFTAGYYTFFKSPFVGVGLANIPEATKPYIVGRSYHNDALNLAVGAGVIGILCWIAVLAAPLVGLRAVARDRFSHLRLYAGSLLFVSLFVFGLTDMTFGYDLPTTLYAFLTAIVLGAFREPGISPAGSSADGRPASRP